ncbi:hypothetical protein [Serratia rhizosphaerae]|uniref:hypothetical protein n=1 Tax=Serratia rhizosphaerae TaxID=2597702 RepID=UPI002DBEE223|nr:hypothetical protein [Serratia rhizosphaerae]MEB6336984.1 hypothetical protein [Serratia rhizosphaerae]
MSVQAVLSQFMHRLRFVSKRSGAWLLLLAWLLLNGQLALAGHGCDLQPDGSAVAAQHMSHLQQATPGMDSHTGADALCEKHCVPDNAQQDHASLSLAALPASFGLSLAIPRTTARISLIHWQTPPIAGPPTEVVFCRFRE